jgi:hypothetical protein
MIVKCVCVYEQAPEENILIYAGDEEIKRD